MTTTSAREHVALRVNERIQVGAADLFLAFEHDLDVHGELRRLRQMRLDRLEVHEDLALVVGSAARVQLSTAHRCLERGRFPQFDRVHRLHVVVPIEEDGRCVLGAKPVAVDNRIPLGFVQFDILQADSAHLCGRPIGAAPNIIGVLGERADTWNGEIRLQLFDVAVAVRVDEIDNGVHGLSSRRFGQLLARQGAAARAVDLSDLPASECFTCRSAVNAAPSSVVALPPVAVRDDPTVGSELVKMRPHTLARGRRERIIEIRVHLGNHPVDRVRALPDLRQYLVFPPLAVFEVSAARPRRGRQ